MNALTDQFAFDTVMRQSAAAAMLNLRRVEEARADLKIPQPIIPTKFTALVVIGALMLASATIFVTGYAALLSETPALWIHRLMALTVVQSILLAAVAMKVLPLIERRNFSVSIRSIEASDRSLSSLALESAANEPLPPPVPMINEPIVGGHLAGREYLEYEDGSIEIDTLVGRRRFISIDAAREFVGA